MPDEDTDLDETLAALTDLARVATDGVSDAMWEHGTRALQPTQQQPAGTKQTCSGPGARVELPGAIACPDDRREGPDH